MEKHAFHVWRYGAPLLVLAAGAAALWPFRHQLTAEAIAAVLIPLGLPVDIPCSAEDYAAAIGLDKKGAGADLTLILLEKLGRAVPHKLPKAELLRLL